MNNCLCVLQFIALSESGRVSLMLAYSTCMYITDTFYIFFVSLLQYMVVLLDGFVL